MRKIKYKKGKRLQPYVLEYTGSHKNIASELQLFVYDDKTFEEIASRLSTSPENARQLVSRGIKKIKQALGRKDD